MTTVNLSATGADQTWTVPPLVYAISVALCGAGQTVPNTVYGGRVELTFPVLPGDVLTFKVGKDPYNGTGTLQTAGGWPDGGNGGVADHTNGGSGSTSLWIGGVLVAVAGAAGGNTSTDSGNTYNGGYGGGLTGGNGSGPTGGTTGGGQTTPNTMTGGAGSTTAPYGGGGGGGGFNGGGGGSASGRAGGGGSGWVTSAAPRGAVSDTVNRGNDPTAVGNGTAVITYTAATPTAPTLLSPINDADVDVSQPVTLSAQFNCPSSAVHVASASFAYKAAGAPGFTTVAADTVNTSTGVVSVTLPVGTFAAGVQVEWQCTTTDNEGNVSPTSPSAFFGPVTVPPAPTITAPAAAASITNLTTQPITIAATTGQTDTQFRRVGDNAGSPDTSTVYEDSGALGSAVLSHNFTAGGTHPLGAEHWQARVRTTSFTWSPWADVAVTADIEAPPAPVLAITVQDSPPSVIVAITNPTPGAGQSASDGTDLYRTWNGTKVRLAAALADNSTVIDYRPGPGDNEYVAVAKAASGATSTSN